MADNPKSRAGFGNDPLLSFEFLNPEGRRLLKERFAAEADKRKIDVDWKATPYSRVALVNRLVWARPDARYLEIGCDDDILFHAVPLANKVGVDPVKGGTHRMTSDDFFAANTEQFDIIFIDGLHTYEQVRRDVINAMGALAPGGWIALHDMVPRTWEEEHVPRVAGTWTGDVWKVAIELSQSAGIAFHVVMVDHGVGLFRVTDAATATLADLGADLSEAGFSRFLAEFDRIPKLDWDGVTAMIETGDAPPQQTEALP